MDKAKFNNLVACIGNLDLYQERKLNEKLLKNAQKRHVSKSLETPYSEVACPHCNAKSVFRWGKRNDMQRYRCKSCNRTFNSLTGTPLAHLRRKGHWLDYADCLKKGLSIRKAAQRCDIDITTSFRWRHRFLKNSRYIKPDCLEGIVETDETYFNMSEKGNKNLTRAPRKRGQAIREWSERVCVLVGRDRNRNTIDALLESFTSERVSKALSNHLAKDVLFCSNSRPVYRKFTRDNGIRHGYINISKGENVKKDIVHIRNVRNYHQHFKHWIHYTFHGVATKYMENYLGWYRELDEYNNKISPKVLLLRAKSYDIYRRQPLTPT